MKGFEPKLWPDVQLRPSTFIFSIIYSSILAICFNTIQYNSNYAITWPPYMITWVIKLYNSHPNYMTFYLDNHFPYLWHFTDNGPKSN